MDTDIPMTPDQNNFESIQKAVLTSSCSKQSLLVPSKIQFRSLSQSKASEDSKHETPKIEKKVRLDCSIRIYFTCYDIKQDSLSMTLMCSDVNQETTPSGYQEELRWNNLISDHIQTSKNFSHEEKLMRERMRLSSTGVSTYEMSKSYGRIVYPLAGKIYTFVDDGVSTDYPPYAIYLKTSGACIQPTSCPHNPELVAYVCGKDLWLAQISSEENVCLASPERREECGVGVPTYIIQEEFDRYIGFWWQPKSTSSSSSGLYRILYEEYDESGVEIVNVMVHSSGGMKSERCYYPKPGKKNAVSDLKIVEFELDKNGLVKNALVLKLSQPLYKLFPNCEYLVRAGWTKDGKYVWCQLLDRLQTNLYLYLLPLENFSSTDDTGFTAICLLIEKQPEFWVPVNDYLQFMNSPEQSGDTESVEFMWVSDKTYYRHLYHMRRSWQTSKLNFSAECFSVIPSNEVLTRQLTSGNWEIVGDNIWINEKRKVVFFLGLREHPLRKNLYAVSYDESTVGSAIIRLTLSDSYSYDCSMDPDLDIAVITYSNLETHAGQTVVRMNYTDTSQNWVNLSEIASLRRPMCHKDVLSNRLSHMEPPRLLQYDISPHLCDNPQDQEQKTLYGLLFLPATPPPDKRGYPCVHYIYGGPCIQLVSGAYNQHIYFKAQLYCHYGYAFLICDSRGSHNRGLKFAGHIKHKMGQIELPEQTEFLKKAAEETGLIDLSRVAIQGSSYGGYMTLMAMCCYSETYRIGYASAPVVDWSLYDTGYTERYMGLPDTMTQAYSYGHVLRYVHNFPRETNRLVISHGGQDENVHIYHTSQLLEKLATYGRPYIFQFYPSSRHRINQTHHWDSTVLAHLEENLKPHKTE